jgi:hypothetical protein
VLHRITSRSRSRNSRRWKRVEIQRRRVPVQDRQDLPPEPRKEMRPAAHQVGVLFERKNSRMRKNQIQEHRFELKIRSNAEPALPPLLFQRYPRPLVIDDFLSGQWTELQICGSQIASK